MYIGELEQIHGYEEAHRFIEKGKYRETVDDDGDICYEKVQYSAKEFKTHSRAVTTRKTRPHLCESSDSRSITINNGINQAFLDTSLILILH